MAKVGIIDLGTNTFHLLIAEIKQGREISELYRERIYVQLAEGGIEKIAAEPWKRAMAALTKFRGVLDEFDIKQYRAFGTAGLRTAKNSAEFRKEVLDKLNLNIELISGDREAELIFKGTSLILPGEKQDYIIMDIGGGSVEFIIYNEDGIKWAQSFKIGVAVLYNNFHKSDPIKESEIQAIRSFLDSHLSDLYEQIKNHDIIALIGASGSFEIMEGMLKLESEQRYNSTDIDKFKSLYHKLIQSSMAERLEMDGLPKTRVKLAVAAFILMKHCFERLDIKKICISPYAMKEGILSEFNF